MIERAVQVGVKAASGYLPQMSRYAHLHAEALVRAALWGLQDEGWRLEPPHRD